MFRENATPTHLASYLAGLVTAVLIAVAGWLVLPATAPSARQSTAASVDVSDSQMSSDLSAARWLAIGKGYERLGLLNER